MSGAPSLLWMILLIAPLALAIIDRLTMPK